MIEHIKDAFENAESKRVAFMAAIGFTQGFIDISDAILKGFQAGIAAVTFAYVTIKFYRYLTRPKDKEINGEE